MISQKGLHGSIYCGKENHALVLVCVKSHGSWVQEGVFQYW